MADYYPLIARAVAGLEKNTGDARRTLYERARTALVAQLRGVNPPLSENDVTRERLALEESIRKVEAEAARKGWVDPAQATPPNRVRAPEFPRWEQPPPSAEDAAEPPTLRRTVPTPARAESAAARQQATARALRSSSFAAQNAAPSGNGMLGGDRYVDPVFDQPLSPGGDDADAEARGANARPRPVAGDRRTLMDTGLKDFREVVSENADPGEEPARVPQLARDGYAPAMPASHEFDRIDARSLDPNSSPLPEYTAPPMLDHDYEDPRPLPGRGRGGAAVDRRTSGRSFGDVIKIALTLLILAGLGAVLAWQWPNMAALYRAARAPSQTQKTDVASDNAPAIAKAPARNTDRYQPEAPSAAPAQSGAGSAVLAPAPSVGNAATVAQKVVLYEEDPDDAQGKRYIGSAIWRTERVETAPGQPPEIAIRADVEIPERKLAMTWSLRRNTDQSLPASHTVEILFRLPQDFPAGGVANVPGILMKSTEQTRGVPLAGLAVKVTDGFFLIGLSSAEGDRERNLQMLRERQWFDIPVVYNNNRRAILAMEKGTPGDRVFAEAFAAWRQ